MEKILENIDNAIRNGIKASKKEDDLVCPFCDAIEFDKIGLKYHLANFCEEYRNIEDL